MHRRRDIHNYEEEYIRFNTNEETLERLRVISQVVGADQANDMYSRLFENPYEEIMKYQAKELEYQLQYQEEEKFKQELTWSL